MAHTVYLGSFSKKLNSTAQPTYTGWTAYSCVFKDETSLYRPTLTLSANWATMAGANYNYAVMMGRYYWITDLRAIRTNVVEVELMLDALATYKSAITSTSAFIEYGFDAHDAGSSAYRLPDRRISVNSNPICYQDTVDPSGGVISKNAGCYIVQAVGNDPNGPHKGLATFALDEAQLRAMMDSINTELSGKITTIFNDPSLNAQQIMNELTGLSISTELLSESAMAAIQSVKWLPLKKSSAVGTPCEMYLGNYSTHIYSALMLQQNTTYWYGSDIDIPWPVADWRRNNCQMLLYLPFFGTVPIPVDQCINFTTINISWSAEYFSGSISVVVRGDNKYTLYTGSTNISVDMGVGRSQVGASALVGGGLQALSGAMEMAGGILDLGAGAVGSMFGFSSVAGKLASIPNGANNMFQGLTQTIQPMITCAGTMGGMAAIAQSMDAVLELLYYEPFDVAAIQAKYGHPVFAMGTPSAGYCKTRGFSVAASAPGYVCASINAAMDGGVFIE